MMTITDTEAAALRTAHDILASLARKSESVMNATPDDEAIAAYISGDSSHPYSNASDINQHAWHAAYDINEVLANVSERTV